MKREYVRLKWARPSQSFYVTDFIALLGSKNIDADNELSITGRPVLLLEGSLDTYTAWVREGNDFYETRDRWVITDLGEL